MLKFLNKLFGIPEPKPPVTITVSSPPVEVKPETIVSHMPENKEPEVKVEPKQKPPKSSPDTPVKIKVSKTPPKAPAKNKPRAKK